MEGEREPGGWKYDTGEEVDDSLTMQNADYRMYSTFLTA